jgi:uncharacterized protein YdcH (DUF465 family)
MIAKAKHKELKTKVNEVEIKRRNDRSSTSWLELRELKKLKLKAKDKLNDIKQKLHA